MVQFSYADHEEIADIIRNGKAGKDFLIVDVRDDDFEGGNITGARNYPSSQFYERLDELYTEAKDVPKVIFHCALSQQRGPKMAKRFAEEFQRRGHKVQLEYEKETGGSGEGQTVEQESVPTPSAHDATDESRRGNAVKPEQEVIVLRGGFTRWQEKYKLVENWKAAIWASPYS